MKSYKLKSLTEKHGATHMEWIRTSDLHTKDCRWRGSSFCSTKGHDRPPRKRFFFSEKFWTGDWAAKSCAVNLGWSIYLICSMFGIFTYIWLGSMANVGKCSIHGASGYYINIIMRVWSRRFVLATLHCHIQNLHQKCGQKKDTFFSR